MQPVLQTATAVVILLLAKNAMLATSATFEAVKHVIPYHAHRSNIKTLLPVLLEVLLDALLVPVSLALVKPITMNLLVALPLLIEYVQLVPLPALQELIKLHALHSQMPNV